MPLGMEVGLGPGHIVLDGDPPLTKNGHTPTFRPMFIVAKRLDGSRCHLVPKVVLGPSNIVFDVDPAPLLPRRVRAPNFRPMFMERKKKRRVFIWRLFAPRYTQSAQAWITQFDLQITPCLHFLRERSPDGTTTTTEAANIQLQLTTHLSTPKGWKAELAWLADLYRTVYPHKWSPISCGSSAR